MSESGENCDIKAVNRLQVLVVRAHRDNDQFLVLLDRAQMAFQSIPIMCIRPLSFGRSVCEIGKNFDRFDFAIFVSASSVKLGVSLLQKYWVQLPPKLAYVCIGDNTAELLRGYGCEVISPKKMLTTEGLLSLPELKELGGKRIVIFRGLGGRENLAEELSNRGALVSYCELYQRQIDEQQVVLARSKLSLTDCLVTHSGELLQSMGPPPTQVVDHLSVVVPSARVATLATEMGYKRVLEAASAMPEAMFEATRDAFIDHGLV